MIRTYNKQTVVVEQGVAKYLADIFCNSADTKPTDGLVNGSKLTEVDTGKTYLFDEANTEWVEYSEGGGGGTGGGMFVITPSYEEVEGEPTVAFDKTYQEIATAIANKIPILIDDSDEEAVSAYMIPQVSIQNGTITLQYPLSCNKNAPTTMAITDICYKVDEENNVEVITTEYVVALNQ